ncbi:MAG: hypothetical protein ABJN34_04810 [Litoreibacter sp.]|uniref:hypothetical protein n=1 Tax=Litoreibacter sp. TaxID=1969459 RepID=UPI003297DCDA
MRSKLMTAGLMSLLLWHSPAHAQVTRTDEIVAQIEAQGFTISDIRKSWFGRIVITATSGDILREIVLNRTSGDILRDQEFKHRVKNNNEEASPPPSLSEGAGGPQGPDSSGGAGNPGGPGNSGGAGNSGPSGGKP